MRLLLALFAFSSFSFGQTVMPANTSADINYIISQTRNGKVSEQLRARFAINKIHGEEFVSFVTRVSISFDKVELIQNGVLVGAQIGDIVSIKYPLAQLDNIRMDDNFSQVHIAGKIRPLLNKVPGDTRVDSVWAGYGLPQGYTGKDVIIGITDWGFDYSSPMYYDTLLQNTRILAAWDQFKTSGPAPTGYSYGTEYSTPTELQNAGADTACIYSYATHGSHVAGIAGGSGAGTVYRGMAFESNYLFTTFLVDEAAVLDAWDWMYSKATEEGKRLVVNMSWGLYHMGAIDGTSLVSQALDALSNQGVIFVSSGGNNGDVNFHLEKTFANDTIRSKIDFYYSASLATFWGQSIHMWGQPGQPFSGGIQVFDNTNTLVAESQYYTTDSTPNYIDSFVVANADTVWFNLSADEAYPTNGRPQIRLRVKYPPSGYKVILKSAAPSGTVHYWNVTELTSDVGNWGMPFTTIGGTNLISGNNTHGIGMPSCSYSCITVAAHTSEYYIPSGALIGGQEATFSSVGPLMNDSLKPDISAPGVSVASSISSYTDNNYNQIASVDFNGRTYPFARFSGTSMSSPAVTGIVALILDANPYLTPEQVKMILRQTARRDQYTGVLPPHSAKWGWGKVNAHAAIVLALNTTGILELEKAPEWTIYPNPATTQLSIANLNGTIRSIQVVDILGRTQEVNLNQSVIDLSNFAGGTYILRIVRNRKVEQRRFVKQ
ncbi:MAG: S8 family peptidase [Crocinitomicaceae bacterium]|nr:S8 family peptidase [Crocinitomicaceae bacterium]